MIKTIDLFALAFKPLLMSLFVFIVWIFSFELFRHFFKFPFGDSPSSYPLSLREIVIYNGIQLLFVCLLFLVATRIYRWVANNLSICKRARRSALLTTILSWVIFSFLSYNMAGFFCCPGLFPEVANPLWWLTSLEFAAFAILGSAYLVENLFLIRNSDSQA
jgi:hypothetical protein